MSDLIRCLFCASTKIEFRFKASDRWHEVEGTFDMHQCRDCGLLFLYPQPPARRLAAHYPSTYYSLQGEHPDQARDERVYKILYGDESSTLKKIAYTPYRAVLRTLMGRPAQRILDVGCGSGHFLAIAKKILGVDAFGVEPYAYNHTVAADENISIFDGTLEAANFPASSFHVITLNHVFEHLENPCAILGELRRILKPGGTLILAVPQSSNLLYWIFGRYWKQLDVPRHLFIPTTKNLAKVASLQGFVVQEIRYNSTPSSILGSLYYSWNHLLGRKAYLSNLVEGKQAFRCLLPLSYLLNFLHIGDQIEMFLTTN